MGAPAFMAALAALLVGAASDPLSLLQVGLQTSSMEADQQPALTKMPETWCGYTKQPGSMSVLLHPTGTDFMIDLTAAFQKHERVRVLITAMAKTGGYMDGMGFSDLFGYPLEDVHNTYFEFKLSATGYEVEVYAPHMALRTSDEQMENALKHGLGSSFMGSFSTMMCGTSSSSSNYASSLYRNSLSASLSMRNDTDATAPPKHKAPSHEVVIMGKDLMAQGFLVSHFYAGHKAILKSARSFSGNVDVTAEYANGMRVGYSMVLLPETPMLPRFADDRLLYFTQDFTDLGQHDLSATERPVHAVDSKVSVIWRYDLATLPGGQIRIHVDPSVPKRWREYYREGVEGWNLAYAEAGFPNAVRGVCPEDADWPEDYDISDARFNVIAYSVSNQVMSMGIAKVDSRSGQIIKSDIVMSDGWVRAWLGDLDLFMPNVTYHLDSKSGFHTEMRTPSSEGKGEVSLTDPDPDVSLLSIGATKREEDMIGQGLKQIVMHETGHILGLRHNFKGSMGVSYNCTQDYNCSAVHGLSSSVMDYLPMNMPGKGNKGPVHAFSPVVGAYDKAVIKYGYMPADDEKAMLTRTRPQEVVAVAAAAEGIQTCYDAEADAQDPSCMRYDMTSDPVAWFEQRLALVADRQQTVLSTAVLPGASYTSFGNSVHKLLYEAGNTCIMLIEWLGGMNVTHAHRALNGEQTKLPARSPMPVSMQRKALSLILTVLRPMENGYLPKKEDMAYLVEGQTDDAVQSEDLTHHVEHITSVVVKNLLSSRMLLRVDSQERHNFGGGKGFTLVEYLSALTDYCFSQGLDSVKPDDWNLQGYYIDNLVAAMGNKGNKTHPETVNAQLMAQVKHADQLVIEAIGQLQAKARRTHVVPETAEKMPPKRAMLPSDEDLLQAHLLDLHDKMYDGICGGSKNCVLPALTVAHGGRDQSGAPAAAPMAVAFMAVSLGLAFRG